MNNDREYMNNHEKDLVLAVVKHYMKPELRRIVMTQVPQAYNAWMSGEYTEVRRVSDGSKL